MIFNRADCEHRAYFACHFQTYSNANYKGTVEITVTALSNIKTK